MSVEPSTLPPPTVLQARLRTITETLAREIARPTLQVPTWSESDWLLARAVASIHGVSALLCRSLRWVGPADWHHFLHEQRIQTERRHTRIQDLLDRIDTAARRDEVAILGLKGAALYQLQLYAPGERPMADVDLLVHEPDMKRTGRLLEGLGFHWTHTNAKHDAFESDGKVSGGFGEDADNGMKIDLHPRIAEGLPQRMVNISPCVCADIGGHGLNYYSSRAALMLHLLLHAAAGMSARALRLVQLVDIARLGGTMGSRDWEEFLGFERSLEEPLWWAYPPLELTARYYDVIPKGIITEMSDRSHARLKYVCHRRTLSDVSFSHLWVTAFPGMEWARSYSEILSYIRQRVVPNEKVRSLRQSQAKTDPAAAESPWTHLSQRQRLLQWLTRRPVRPQAMRSIRLALTQRPSPTATQGPPLTGSQSPPLTAASQQASQGVN